MTPITEDQKATFLDQGYLLLTEIIPDVFLQAVIDELNFEIDRRARKLMDKGMLSDLFENEGFETRLAKISSQTPKLAVSIWNGVLSGPAIFKLISCPQLLDVAEAMVGPRNHCQLGVPAASKDTKLRIRRSSLASGFKLFRAILRRFIGGHHVDTSRRYTQG